MVLWVIPLISVSGLVGQSAGLSSLVGQSADMSGLVGHSVDQSTDINYLVLWISPLIR